MTDQTTEHVAKAIWRKDARMSTDWGWGAIDESLRCQYRLLAVAAINAFKDFQALEASRS